MIGEKVDELKKGKSKVLENAHKNPPTPQDHHRSLGIWLLYGPKVCFMGEVLL